MKQLLLSLATFFLAIITLNAQSSSKKEAQKLQIALYAVSNLYVDSTDEQKLVENAIVGMLEKLDPHSTYTDAEETKAMTEPLEGNFDGIGIQFNMLTDTLYVIQVIPGGPSEKVGLIAGDRIITVNDTTIAGVKIKNTDVMKMLRGKKGTEVRLGVMRGGDKNLISFRITRDKIPVYSLDAAYMADKRTGYIKLNRFALSTYKEFQEAFKKLEKQGMKNLILDLQGNGGGYLNIAIDLADAFLQKNKAIVYTEGLKQQRQTANATATGEFEKGKLIVLIDETSASASEIVAGAVQDWDRGIIIGRRSFGKGLVQKPIPLPDGSMIRLTVSRYYTPTGRCIQKPYVKGATSNYEHDLINRYNSGELTNKDSIHFPDSLQFSTLVKSRTVYGGGGIMPDIFIPIDTASYSDYHRNLVTSGLINRMSMKMVDENREKWAKEYKDIKKYKDEFSLTQNNLQSMIDMATSEGIEYKEDEYMRSKERIALQLKALIARDIFDMSEYYQVINDEDNVYEKALQIINSDDDYNKILGIK